MTKLSIIASRALVGFGIATLVSANAATIEVTDKIDEGKTNLSNLEVGTDVEPAKTPQGTGLFKQRGNAWTYSNKTVTAGKVAAVGKDDTINLRLSEEYAGTFTDSVFEDVENFEQLINSFSNNTNSFTMLLPTDETTKKSGATLNITNEATMGLNLTNYHLKAKTIDVKDTNLFSTHGESLVEVDGVAGTDKLKISTTNGGSINMSSPLDVINNADKVGMVWLSGSGSLRVTGDFETDKALYIFANANAANKIKVDGTAKLSTNDGFLFASTNGVEGLVLKNHEILSANAIYGVSAGDQPAQFSTSNYAAVLVSKPTNVLGGMSKELEQQPIIKDVSDKALNRNDQLVNFAYMAENTTTGQALNGFYTSADGKKLLVSSELIRNSDGVANANNLGKTLANAASELEDYKTSLAGSTRVVVSGKIIEGKISDAGSVLKEIYDERDTQVTNVGGTLSIAAIEADRNREDRQVITEFIKTKQDAVKLAQTAYNEAKAALDADPTNATKAAALAFADSNLTSARTDLATAQDYLTTFDKDVALIREGKSLWAKADAIKQNYDDITNNQAYYFKWGKNSSGEYNTGKLNKAGIRKMIENVDVGSHRGLAVNIYDSLQESNLSEGLRTTFDPAFGNLASLKTASNDIHDTGRSATNFANSVNTAINVSNEMALGDRIAKANNPYNQKLAAVGTDAYNDFYHRTDGSVWVNAFGGTNIVDGESGGIYGISLGADKQVTDSALIGMYFTYADSDLKDKSLKQESDNFQLGIYSNIKLNPEWELNLRAYGQLGQTDQYSSLLGETYTSDFDKKFFGFSGSIGRIVEFENSLFLKPFAGLNYYYANTPSYTEKGGNLPREVDESTNNSVSLDVGLEVRKYFNETSYVFVTPKIEQYLMNNGDDYVSSFSGSPIDFSVSASDKLKTYGQLIVGGSFGVTDSLNVELGLGAKQILTNKVDDKNETYLSGNLGLKYKF